MVYFKGPTNSYQFISFSKFDPFFYNKNNQFINRLNSQKPVPTSSSQNTTDSFVFKKKWFILIFSLKLFWQSFSQNFKLVGFYTKTFITPPFCFNEAFCFYWWVVLIIKIFILHCKNFIAPLIFLFALQLEGVSDIFLSNQALVHAALCALEGRLQLT